MVMQYTTSIWPKGFLEEKHKVYSETTSKNIVTGELFHFFPEMTVWAKNEQDCLKNLVLGIQWTDFFHENKKPYDKEYYKNPAYFINYHKGVAYVQLPTLENVYDFDLDSFHGKMENMHMLGFSYEAFKQLHFKRRNPSDITKKRYRSHVRSKYFVGLTDDFIEQMENIG